MRIVLTGGPCGGKTTALSRISERLQSHGFRVFQVPEAATLLITGGIQVAGMPPGEMLEFEAGILRLQKSLEEEFLREMKKSEKSVILCDRGAMDVAAYLSPDHWQALLDQENESVVSLRDRRYDAVIHLVTAAEGAEAFYSTDNNAARYETPEQARAVDKRLREAWVGHPHLRVIGNEGDFADKIRRVIDAVCRATGIPTPVEVERKFLVKKVPEPFPVHHQEVEIEQTYLRSSDGSEARVRRRGQWGSYTYTHTIKKPIKAGQRVEVERPLTSREYVGILSQADSGRQPVRKMRTCFLHEHQYFELDRFLEPRPGLMLLEAELDRENQEILLPPFIEIEREVTDEKEYSNHAIAAKMTSDG